MPVMRPLFLEFPEDKNCYTDEHLTFLFGSSVLVANVVEKGAKTREIYLPKGSVWYDMNDILKAYGESGAQTIEVPVTLASIPMFFRDSGIYVTSEDVTQIKRDTLKTLNFLVSCKNDVEFTYYDDDGWSKKFEEGEYASTCIEVKAGDRKTITFTKSGSFEETWDKLELNLVSKEKGAYWVSVEGEKIARFLTKESFEEAESGWYYDMSDRIIRVKCPKPEKDSFTVVISCEKFDLIGMEFTD